MVKLTRRRKMRGGAKVAFAMMWKANGKKADLDMDFADYITRQGLPAEVDYEVADSDIHDVSALVDYVEMHVLDAGYKSAKIPLQDNMGGHPSTLGSITAEIDGTTAPSPVPEFTGTVRLPNGKKIKVSATFVQWKEKSPEDIARAKREMEEFMKSYKPSAGKRRKVTRRR